MFGFHRIATARPEVALANPERCLESVKRLAEAAENAEAPPSGIPKTTLDDNFQAMPPSREWGRDWIVKNFYFMI